MTNATHLLEVYTPAYDRPKHSLSYQLSDIFSIVPTPGYTVAQLAAFIIDCMPEEQANESAFRIVPTALSPEMQRLRDTM